MDTTVEPHYTNVIVIVIITVTSPSMGKLV